jgi:leucine dehydrogenase
MDPSPFTALGVFEGIRSALRHRFGTDDFEGRSVLVEGVGAVGETLAERLAEAGATVLLADIDAERAESVARRLGGMAVPMADVPSTRCDVYAPCAVGATLNAETIPELGCAIVAGAANNQLAEPGDARRLLERGILYAPDYVINGGGAMAFTSIYMGVEDLEEVERRVRSIGTSLDMIFAEAAERGASPVVGAQAHVARVLQRGPRGS